MKFDVSFILGNSTNLDLEVTVRLIVLLLTMESILGIIRELIRGINK